MVIKNWESSQLWVILNVDIKRIFQMKINTKLLMLYFWEENGLLNENQNDIVLRVEMTQLNITMYEIMKDEPEGKILMN